MKISKTGPKPLSPYSLEVEKNMKDTYIGLSEKERRKYAAVEAIKLPHGGITYIARLFRCSRKTVYIGIKELNDPENADKNRIRKVGGGRKSAIDTIHNINIIFLEVIEDHTAGDPMDSNIKWTNLSRRLIAEKMKEKGIDVSVTVIIKLLKINNFKKRKALKNKAIGSNENRDKQFERIDELKTEYSDSDNPILSIDTKKKELLGNLYREGKLYCTDSVEVYDHDFPHLADGVIIPYTIYDLKNNEAYVNIGTGKDTSEFVCDSLRNWWKQYGIIQYPKAASILIPADGGGSNSSRHYIFKEDLQKLVNELGIEIRMAHYPPYTSKWNPVEHRVFPHITRSLSGVILRKYEFVKELIENTSTAAGLKVSADISKKIYKTGRKYADNFKVTMSIIFDTYLGQWNYRAVPENG